MNCAERIKLRMKAEGILRTIEYILCVYFYCFRECCYEIYFDLRYSGRVLKGNCRTIYKNLGANDVYHTKYSAMPLIFRFVRITDTDVLVDVGCGKGRMINYWLSRKLGNRIFGLELDPRVANYTARNLSKWRNVTIKSGDAIANLPEDGTVFYFYNPFSEEKVREFEEALSVRFANKPITVIYYNPKSLKVFRNGKWRIRNINFEKELGIRRWGRINKYHELAVITNKVDRSVGGA